MSRYSAGGVSEGTLFFLRSFDFSFDQKPGFRGGGAISSITRVTGSSVFEGDDGFGVDFFDPKNGMTTRFALVFFAAASSDELSLFPYGAKLSTGIEYREERPVRSLRRSLMNFVGL